MEVQFLIINIVIMLIEIEIFGMPNENLECQYCSPTYSNCLQSDKDMEKRKCIRTPDYKFFKERSEMKDLPWLKPTCFVLEYINLDWKIKRKYSCANDTVKGLFSSSFDKIDLCAYFERMPHIDFDSVEIFRKCSKCDDPLCNVSPGEPDPVPSLTTRKSDGDLLCHRCRSTVENCEKDGREIDVERCSSTYDFHRLKESIDPEEFKYLKPKCYFLEFENDHNEVIKKYGCSNTTLKNPLKNFEEQTICQYYQFVELAEYDTIATFKYCATCDTDMCNTGRGMVNYDPYGSSQLTATATALQLQIPSPFYHLSFVLYNYCYLQP